MAGGRDAIKLKATIDFFIRVRDAAKLLVNNPPDHRKHDGILTNINVGIRANTNRPSYRTNIGFGVILIGRRPTVDLLSNRVAAMSLLVDG